MNTLLLFTLLATAAAASVSNQEPEVPEKAEVAKVAEVPKAAEVAEVPKAAEAAEVPKAAVVPQMTKVDEEPEMEELGEIQYDQDGVPMRTIPAERQSLRVGVIGPDDRLVSRITHNVAAAAFLIHEQDVTFNGAHQTNITSIQVDRVGTTMHAIPTIKAGGLGRSFVTINILGVRGSGFSYTISIHATIGCANS